MNRRMEILALSGMLFLLTLSGAVYGQKPYRVGTTSGNFLEIGYGGAGTSMGDAYVSMARDLSSVYWNPAGLGFMETNEFQVSYQPWVADINTSFLGVGYTDPMLGTFAAALLYVDYGQEEVTSVMMQEGTGEEFGGKDLSFSLSYGRRLAEWFSFGATGKYVSSSIWHESASAAAFDLGAIVNTNFLSPTGERKDGLNIGVSIANYGTRMRYDGIDLKRPVDIAPDENGNYGNVAARFETDEWELPLLFRMGVSAHPVLTNTHRLTLSVDALHTNNNSEYVNVGGEYRFKVIGQAELTLRCGYKGLFMSESEYGVTFGGGIKLLQLNNRALKVDYCYRDLGILGGIHCYNFGIEF